MESSTRGRTSEWSTPLVVRLTLLLGLCVSTGLAAPAAPGSEGATREQIETIISSGNPQAIYLLALAQIKAHPDDPRWQQLADIAMKEMEPPRTRLTASQLPPDAGQQLARLSAEVGNWSALPPADQAPEAAGMMSAVKKFAGAYPDLPTGWLLQAQVALLANRPLEGRIAAKNLEELRAWETTSKEVLLLLSQLQIRGWMPALQADDSQRQALDQFCKTLDGLSRAPGMKEKLPAVLSEVKTFCNANNTLPNGWLLQLGITAVLGRSLEESIALKQLAALRPAKKP